eukprot:g9072.t1
MLFQVSLQTRGDLRVALLSLLEYQAECRNQITKCVCDTSRANKKIGPRSNGSAPGATHPQPSHLSESRLITTRAPVPGSTKSNEYHLLLVANCGNAKNSAPATAAGEVGLRFWYGYLSGVSFAKYEFYWRLLVAYVVLALVWIAITLCAKLYHQAKGNNREVKILLVHQYLGRILLVCLVEVFLWFLKFQNWNSTGNRRWILLFLARMAYSLKVSMFWVMISLLVAKCCGVYRLILSSEGKDIGAPQKSSSKGGSAGSTCSLFSMIRGQFGERAKRVISIAACYTVGEFLWQLISIYQNQRTFVEPQLRQQFVSDRLFYGLSELLFVVFIASWILKTLDDNRALMLASKNAMLIQAYSRMRTVLRLTFGLKIFSQAVKYLYYPVKFTFGSAGSSAPGVEAATPGGVARSTTSSIAFYDLGDGYHYFEVVLPHLLDFCILSVLFLIWYPRPEFSHVDREDTRLMLEEQEEGGFGKSSGGARSGKDDAEGGMEMGMARSATGAFAERRKC